MGKLKKDMSVDEIFHHRKRAKEWYYENRQYVLAKALSEYKYKEGRLPFSKTNAVENRRARYLMKGFGNDGMCLICGELDPRYHIQHHVLGKEDSLTITLCANCHKKYLAMPKYKHYERVMKAIDAHILLKREDSAEETC